LSWIIKNYIKETRENETGAQVYPPGLRHPVAFIYPNVYHLGMSNLGMHILYQMINERGDSACERFFLPDKRLQQEHIKSKTPLLSLENQRPLADFDVIFVMLSFEMDYDNLLTVLDLGNIRLRAAERNQREPLVIIGGLKRISQISQIVVPFMAVAYVLCCLILMACNVKAIPAAVVEIVRSAFGMDAVAGGALGAMMVAMQKGIARGIFSNEAGLGSAPIAAAAAKTKEPVRQGLVTMTGTFIDTIVICTMTGLAIVVSGAWQNPELEGVEITDAAFQHGLPFPGQVSSFILMACLVFFAFTTILGWSYYSERCLTYLRGKSSHALTLSYRWLYIVAVFIGPYLTVEAVWDTADIFNGLMAFPNVIALIVLSGVVAQETKQYFKEKRHLL
jgi:hypothetical protein